MGLIIFDCDGVLVDSEPIAHGLLGQMMTDLGNPISTAESIQKFTGRSLADTLPLIEDFLGRSIPDQMGQHYSRLLLERLRRDLRPIAGVKEAVAMLNYPRCVASSSSLERIHLSLEVTGLSSLFSNTASLRPISTYSQQQGWRWRPRIAWSSRTPLWVLPLDTQLG